MQTFETPPPMDIKHPTPLLGGLSPRAFMKRHWQKSPLVIRAAVTFEAALPDAKALFALASQEGVESRLVERHGEKWSLRQGPFARATMPSPKKPAWSLLVQGVDLHDDAAHALLQRFRFIPDARLDDVMLSYASDGGGVGPHVDSYDVFLLQVQGSRRWRVGPPGDQAWRGDGPLRMLAHFEPTTEWLLEPGDMLYLPPGWGHDGVAEGACITCSIGFRAPKRNELATDLLHRTLDAVDPDDEDVMYRDRSQAAVDEPGRIPEHLHRFAVKALERAIGDARAQACALGEVLSEPKPGVVFEAPVEPETPGAIRLDRRTRMLYDDWHVFINGESFRASGGDQRLMRRLADRRGLDATERHRLSGTARALVNDWIAQGWLRCAR